MQNLWILIQILVGEAGKTMRCAGRHLIEELRYKMGLFRCGESRERMLSVVIERLGRKVDVEVVNWPFVNGQIW